MASGSKTASFPSNYVTVAHLQERWVKERDQEKKKEEEEEEDRGRERAVEGETGGSREITESANKVPSFPSNYVTFAHLQGRWLKERDEEKKKKEQEIPGRERKRLDGQAEAEIRRKKEAEKLERERKRVEEEAAMEILRKKEEGDRELKSKGADDGIVQRRRNCVFEAPDFGAVAGEEEKRKQKKKHKKKQKGAYRYVERDVSTQIDEVEPKFCSFPVIGWNEAGPLLSEVNELNHKIGVSSVNRWVRKGGDGKAEERHGCPVETDYDMDPESRVLLASEGSIKNGKLRDRRAKGKQEMRQFSDESKPKDELNSTVINGPKCEVFLANGGPRRNGKMGNRWAKTKQEMGQFGHEGKPDKELDLTCGVFPANGGPVKNKKMGDRQAKGKQDTEQFGPECKPDDELDPTVNSPKCKVLPSNGGRRKKGKMGNMRGKQKQETGQSFHESKPEDELDLDLTVVSKPNCGVLPANGGPRKNGTIGDRRAKGKQEARQFGHDSNPNDELDATVVNEPISEVLPANGGPRKNGKTVDRRAKGKQETRQLGLESKPQDELDLTVVSEPKRGVFREAEDGGLRRSSGKKEAEKRLESNGSDRKSDIGLVLGNLSLDEGPSKNVKKGREMPKKSREGQQVNLESNCSGKSEKSGVFSDHRGVRIDDSGSLRNGETKVSRETLVESYGVENQKGNIEPELKALSPNQGRKKGKKGNGRMRKCTESKPVSHELDQIAETKQEEAGFSVHGGYSQGTGAEMMVIKNPERERTQDEARPKSNKLRQADSAQKVEILSLYAEVRRNGKKEVKRGTKDETITEIIDEEEQMNDFGHELRTLSVNDGIVNGEKVYKWAEKDPEVGVSSINGGFGKDEEKKDSRGGLRNTRSRDPHTCRESKNCRKFREKYDGMAWVKKE